MKYKRRLYDLRHYTESGDLKAPPLLLYILFFLSRTWVLLLISVTSTEVDNNILRLFYPDQVYFYFGLIIGGFPLIVFLVSGRRHAQDNWAIKCWPFCFYLIIFSVFGDISLQFYYLYLDGFKYSLTASLQVVIIIWASIYILKSNQLRDSFIKHSQS